MNKAIIYLSKLTRSFLEKNYKNLNLHFVSRFPDNSCESVSLILGKVLSEEFPEHSVFLVKGTDPEPNEMHFWVEINDLALDITADQFEGINAPIYGIQQKQIIDRFKIIEKMHIKMALETNSFSTSRKLEFELISNEIKNGITT